MSVRPALPNLLDDLVSREEISRLLARLRELRRRIFEAWMARHQSRRLEQGVERTIDEACILALAVEYVHRKWPADLKPVSEMIGSGNHLRLADFTQKVARQTQDKSLRRAFRRGVCVSRMLIPAAIARQIFLEEVPEALKELSGPLPITILGDCHQFCLATPLAREHRHVNERRARGAHYTPAPLVDYMVARSLPSVLADCSNSSRLRILDPSCGCGAFLIAVLRCLAAPADPSCHSTDTFCPSACIYGGDIDRRAVALAGLALALASKDSSGDDRRVPRSPGRGPRLLVQDFLARGAWQRQQFDLIIGGPPFVRVEHLHRTNPRKVREYRKRYVTARTGQFDLYMPFVEKSIGLLRPSGRLALSVASSFLRSRSGATLRGLIKDTCQVEEIIEFEEGNLYRDASVQIALLLLRRGPAADRTRYVFVPRRAEVRRQLVSLIRSRCRSISGSMVRRISLHDNAANAWNLHSDHDRDFAAHLETVGMPLGKLPVRVSLGMCTGADGVYLLKRLPCPRSRTTRLATREGIGIELETDVLKPILRTRQRNTIKESELPYVCVFPYDQDSNVISESRFQKEFPRAYEYLRLHRSQLRRRRLCPGQPWYALRKVEVAGLLAKPKIITPTVCSKDGFLLDRRGILCHHGLLLITPLGDSIDVHYLLGVLNSGLLWRYICLRAAPITGGRRVLRLQLARTLPVIVPVSRRQLALARQIAGLARMTAGRDRRTRGTKPEVRISKLVSDLYGMSPHT